MNIIAVANWIRFEVYIALHNVKYVVYGANIDACSEVFNGQIHSNITPITSSGQCFRAKWIKFSDCNLTTCMN